MKRTNWTQQRLQRLFQRYDRHYWRGKLSRYSVSIGDLKDKGAVGFCYRPLHKIVVDIAAHNSDAEIRATLLHEMAHAADNSTSRYAHGDGFFRQIEHLLRERAPITLKMPEMPGHQFPLSAVPAKFPLCRKSAAKLEARRAGRVKKWMKKHPDKMPIQITTDYIISEFEDAAMECTWAEAKYVIGTRYGLIDVEHRPNSVQNSRVLNRARRAFTKARREYFAARKREEQLRKQGILPPATNSAHE